MRILIASLVSLATAGACERSTKSSPQPAPVASSVAPVPADAASDVERIAADVRASITELLGHSERVFAIMREHGTDCDVAAKHLAELAPAFLELGPRMMKVKESLQGLSESERERIKRESDEMMEAFQSRNADVEALDRRAKECEKTSAAFADVAPKVMFAKKK